MSVNTKVNGELVKSAGLYSVTKPIGMADIYSTEEKEVGLWVNNKPLYQKSFYVDSLPSSAGTKNIATGLTGIEMCKLGECWSNGFGEINIVRCESANAITYGVGCWVAVTNGVPTINIEVGRDRSSIDAWITIQYTKIADTPWSGKFVPQGYGYVSSGDIYSFEERRIGVWTDGKPLYQKTFDMGDIASSSNAQVDLSSLNIDEVVYLNGTGKDASGNTISIPFAHTVNITSNVFCRYNSNGSLGVYTGSQTVSNDTIVTIQYTKTTDVAGSGEYVPSGDKAVHYSTEEEVIGTFMGETLYRKTFNLSTALACQSNVWAYIENSSIGTGVIPNIINAIATDPNGSFFGFIGSNYNDRKFGILNVRNAQINVKSFTVEYTKIVSS